MSEMTIWIRDTVGNSVSFAEVNDRATLGSGSDNDITLENDTVPRRALMFQQTDDGWIGRTFSECTCSVEQNPIAPGAVFGVESGTRISLFPFELEVEFDQPSESETLIQTQMEKAAAELIHGIHLQLLDVMNIHAKDQEHRNDRQYILGLEHHIDQLAKLQGLHQPESRPLVNYVAGMMVQQEIHQRVMGQHENEDISELANSTEAWCRSISRIEDMERELDSHASHLCKRLKAFEGSDLSEQLERVRLGFAEEWAQYSKDLFEPFLKYLATQELKKQLKDIVFGYGPLEDLLRMPTVSEIMLVSRDKIYVERNGVVENSGRCFSSNDVVHSVVDRIVSRVGRRIDKSQPLVDARLSDGSRVNAIIPPLAVSGPCLTIRKFMGERITTQQLVRKYKAMTAPVARFLRACVISKKNIVISGGTGTGKTTLLNCLSEFIPDKERIVTVEDTAELLLKKNHVVTLETKNKNVENKGGFDIRALVKNTLRMRPDRIIVGECRSGEALDMLQAMNTGHDGSMTTLHANSSNDALLRLEVLVGMGCDLPIDSIRRQIASAIDVIIQIHREDRRRFVATVTEVLSFDPRTNVVRTKDLFQHNSKAGTDRLVATGRLPTFMEELVDKRLVDLETFYS